MKKTKKQVDCKKLPYFETKVVKVKKNRSSLTPDNCSREVTELCKHCYYLKKYCEERPKGNRVNGENLDKIKFPVPCSYVKDGEKKFGLFSMNRGYYYIADITKQKKEQEDVSEKCYDLGEFIKHNDIHILKGKIIIFEEE